MGYAFEHISIVTLPYFIYCIVRKIHSQQVIQFLLKLTVIWKSYRTKTMGFRFYGARCTVGLSSRLHDGVNHHHHHHHYHHYHHLLAHK